MSTLETSFVIKDRPDFTDNLILKKDGFKGELAIFTGKSGDFFLSMMPSLNVSGYGNSPEESLEDLKYNLKVFSDDLFAIPFSQAKMELKKLGWNTKKMFPKKFSNAFIDEKGVLQNFDNPTEVEKQVLEAA